MAAGDDDSAAAGAAAAEALAGGIAHDPHPPRPGLAGIALAGWLSPPLPVLGLLALPGLAAMLLWRREPGPRLAAVCTLAFVLGGARLVWATLHFGPGDLATYNDRGPVTLVGVVDDEPDVRDTYQNLRLRAESLTLEGSPPISVTGLALVRAPRYPARAYGDRLAVSGELETPPVLEDFSYKDYMLQFTKRLCANCPVGPTVTLPDAIRLMCRLRYRGLKTPL